MINAQYRPIILHMLNIAHLQYLHNITHLGYNRPTRFSRKPNILKSYRFNQSI